MKTILKQAPQIHILFNLALQAMHTFMSSPSSRLIIEALA